MSGFRELMEWVGTAVDGAGVLVVVIGVFVATTRFAARGRGDGSGSSYRTYR